MTEEVIVKLTEQLNNKLCKDFELIKEELANLKTQYDNELKSLESKIPEKQIDSGRKKDSGRKSDETITQIKDLINNVLTEQRQTIREQVEIGYNDLHSKRKEDRKKKMESKMNSSGISEEQKLVIASAAAEYRDKNND